MAADLPLELANHATRLLEEHDFTNVLNHIPADAFNDLFTGNLDCILLDEFHFVRALCLQSL